ncbi:sulfite exporter TauE/SafE family protein [Novosphingobium sp. Gsoil 351]|uniref:sulfite exporter TauE/SafE family protein n=1 Tax=Novosphingobium sp. Gsoil 351 TaxID=2675225 RepID=UPI0012B49D0E|nr:sulfite exporter TauE/SafE family protein [Novosphingobium sp. Gsoil 351]QGN53477.1 TSUP family transporter [Novosphingobium sp. Gsoil 351]
MPLWLIPGFFGTALLYASVGFGGGSTYSALLALAGTDFRILPIISLACNIVVVTGGVVRFARAGEMPWRGALTVSLIAAPLAFLGGLTPIKEAAFLTLLGASLVFAALALLLPIGRSGDDPKQPRRTWVMALAAAPLGYLAGLVGIGGGIFLAPLLHLARWNSARRIAATASLFILINSFTGLAGQVAKSGLARFGEALGGALPLLLAVVIGGQIGSYLALRYLPAKVIRWLTAALTGWVGVRLLIG